MDGWKANFTKVQKEAKANVKKCPEPLKELCETASDMVSDVMDYAKDGGDEVSEMEVCF